MALDPSRSDASDERTVVRAPNHLGDVVLALPALLAGGCDVMVARELAPILAMSGVAGDVLPLDRGPGGFLRAVRELRTRRYGRGVLMSAAFSAAWLFRWGGVRRLRGTRTDGRGLLLREPIDPARLRGRHRVEAFGLLAGLPAHLGLGPPRIAPPPDRIEAWRSRVGRLAPEAGLGADTDARPAGEPSSDDARVEAQRRPLVALFPGANAPARRWPVERFAEVAHRLAAGGARIVVLGGPAERALTARVAEATPAAADLGGATDLVDLAAILSLCDLVITNDTGPMHLAGAVGTATVSLWGSSDAAEVRQTGALDVRVTGADLPCRPCYRNECHRRGRGTRLADAHEECMRLIEVQDVAKAALDVLAGDDALG